MTKRLPVIGLAAMALGALLGFWPLSSQGVACGSVFSPADLYSQPVTPVGLLGSQDPVAACDATVASMKYPESICLVGGFIVVLVGVWPRRRSAETGPGAAA